MEFNVSFTMGQLFGFLFAIVGLVCLVVLTVYIVILLRRVSKAATEATALIRKAHDTLDEAKEAAYNTIDSVTDHFGKVKTAFKIIDKIKINKNKNI